MTAKDPESAARRVLDRLQTTRRGMLVDLRCLVQQDSPTGDVPLLAGTAEWLARWFAPLGRVETIRTQPDSAPHVLLEAGIVEDGRTPLVLCHYDTVWPAGTVAQRPFSITRDYAYGPGVLDMKASIVLVRHVLGGLGHCGIQLTHGVRLLLSSDEERGNPTSRQLIADLARRSNVALVMEPPLEGGRLKTARKGHALIQVEVQGRSAHAGIEPERGVSAVVEAAHVALRAHALNDYDGGTVVNVGKLTASHMANVVAPSASLELDVRAATDADLERVLDTLRALRPKLPGARLSVGIVQQRPAMQRMPQTDPLVAAAKRIAAAIGMDVDEGVSGGVSEGNLTQAAGTPTLDGLGVEGSGAHTPDERIKVSSLLERAALHAGLLVELSDAAPTCPVCRGRT
jgi:glutamate carboxypeptidase